MISVKGVLKSVVGLLGLSDLVPYFSGENISVGGMQEIDNLVVATNMAIGNIAANYLSVYDKVKVVAKDENIKFSNITDKAILQIKRVTRNGDKIDFKVRNDCLELSNGECEILYSYFPDMVTINDNIDYFGKLNELLFAYAVAAEYLFLKGQIDDAYMWDKRFKASILSIQRPAKNIVMPKRRWWH